MTYEQAREIAQRVRQATESFNRLLIEAARAQVSVTVTVNRRHLSTTPLLVTTSALPLDDEAAL